MRIPPPSLLGLLGLSVTAAAQEPPTYTVVQRPWQGSTMGTVTLGVAGHLTGTGYPDVVVVSDGKPVLYHAPALFTDMEVLPGVWSGVTSLGVRDGGPGPFRQQLIVSDAIDLHLVVVAPQAGIFHIPLGMPSWRSVRSLTLHDLDGDGISDALGIDQNGHELRILQGTPGGIGEERAYTSGTTIDAAASVEWSTGERKVAFVTAGKLMLMDQELQSAPTQIATGLYTKTIALLDAAVGDGTSYLVWCTASGSNAQVQWFNSTSAGSTAVAGHALVAAAAGDLDADGDHDLAFTLSSSQQALVLYGDLGFAFTDLTSDLVDLSSTPSQPSPANMVVPVLADLEADGDCDMAIATAIDQPSAVVLVMPDVRTAEDNGLLVSGGVTNDPLDGSYHVTFDVDGSPPPGSTHLELTHWKLDATHSIASAGVVTVADIANGEIEAVFESQHVAYASYPGLSLSYLVMIRPVVLSGGETVEVYPPLVGGFAHEVPAILALEALPGALPSVSIGNDLGGLSGGGYVGFVIPPPPNVGSGTVP